ncbi:MAG: transcriptional regulator, partial [Actinomycetota bacterium]|nr:transcriptional regulator [Actinomycetota bacterium]
MTHDLESTSTGEFQAMRIRMLGGFRVLVGSRSIEENEWRLKKSASLVKLLALAEDHRLHRERAADLLWSELEPGAAVNNLHQALHVARRVLDSEAAASSYLRLHDEFLELCPNSSLWVDVEAFEEAVKVSRRSRDPAAYRAAIDLYAGDLLPEDRYEDWPEERREELRLTYLSLLIEVAELYEQLGDIGAATEALQKVVAVEPTQEKAHADLMRLYASTGQRYQALRQYEQLRQALGQEPDAQPDAQSRRLYEE